MSRKRQWIGIACLILSVAALIVWEQWGRSFFLKSDVLLTSQMIPEGTALEPSMFAVGAVEDTALAEGAFRASDLSKLKGKVSKTAIPKNSQITSSFLRDSDYYFAADESVYVLRGEWITLRSASLRSGDSIDLYSREPDSGLWERIGTYRVAFVKDQNESEVVSTAGTAGDGILSRTDSSAEIYNVEIVATFAEYEKILQKVAAGTDRAFSASAAAKSDCEATLMIVQRGELT